jgi:hypothetical protein
MSFGAPFGARQIKYKVPQTIFYLLNKGLFSDIEIYKASDYKQILYFLLLKSSKTT